MKDRIKQVRKYFHLTQEEFGARIGITTSSVSLLESGRNNPSQQTLLLICQEFQVSYAWLKEGVGEMLAPDQSPVSELVARYSFPEIVARLLYAFDALPLHQQEAVLAYARSFLSSLAESGGEVNAALAQKGAQSAEAAARQALLSRLEREESSPSRPEETGIA